MINPTPGPAADLAPCARGPDVVDVADMVALPDTPPLRVSAHALLRLRERAAEGLSPFLLTQGSPALEKYLRLAAETCPSLDIVDRSNNTRRPSDARLVQLALAEPPLVMLVRDNVIVTIVTHAMTQRNVFAGTWAPVLDDQTDLEAVMRFGLKLPEVSLPTPPTTRTAPTTTSFAFGSNMNSIDPRQILGRLLQQHRERRSLTRKMVSDRIYVSVGLVEDYERGQAVPGAREWARYCTRVDRGLRNYDDTWRSASTKQRSVTPTTAPVQDEPVTAQDLESREPAANSLPPVRPDTFSTALRVARTARGDGAAELADALSVHTRSVTCWEAGSNMPVAESMEKVVSLYPELAPWAPFCRAIAKPVGRGGPTPALTPTPAPAPAPAPAPLPTVTFAEIARRAAAARATAPVPAPAPVSVPVPAPVPVPVPVPVSVPVPVPVPVDPIRVASDVYADALKAAHLAKQHITAAEAALTEAQAAVEQATQAVVDARQVAVDRGQAVAAANDALMRVISGNP